MGGQDEVVFEGHSFALNASGYLTAGTITTFATWITGPFSGGASVPADKRGPNDDPDNDGIPNLVEYAIAGHDPTLPNATIGTFAGNTLSFTKRTGTTGLICAIQHSTDLGALDPWAEVSGVFYVNTATTISYTFTASASPAGFLRLRVQSN